MTFVRLHDMQVITATITHPRIYRHVADDLAPHPEHYVPCDHPSMLYLGAYDEGEYLGLFAFAPANSICWEVHTCLLPSAWGERAKVAASEAVEWVWKNTPCQRIITSVPAYNSLAFRLAVAAGFERFGVNHRSFIRNGRLLDQILLGISKPEENECPSQPQFRQSSE